MKDSALIFPFVLHNPSTCNSNIGHIAVKFLVAMGCEVYVISTSPKKEMLAKELGAHHFIVMTDEEAKKAHTSKLDFIIDTGALSYVYPGGGCMGIRNLPASIQSD